MINIADPATTHLEGVDIGVANRLGAQKGLNLQPRHSPNLEETTAGVIWRRPDGTASIIYDPWCSNQNAQVIHGHYHTSWARNIYYNKINRAFEKSASFDWKGKAVYIAGRGKSLKKNLAVLNSIERKNPIVFISSAYVGQTLQPQDFVMIADNRILSPGHSDYSGAINNPLISFPGIDGDIVGDNWNGVYGFAPWSRSPINDFIRELFPHLPPILDILTTAVMATHLACLNGAGAIVYIGMDNTVKGAHKDTVKTKDIHGNKCKTIQGYYEMATAVAQFSQFAHFHCNTRFINATGAGILGVDYFTSKDKKEHTLFQSMEQITAEKAIEEFG